MEKVLQSELLYRGKIVNLRRDTILLQKGAREYQVLREIVEHGQSVTLVPVDDAGMVLLVQQYRRAAETVLLETPAGGVDPGESPEEAAHRELQEETGYKATHLVPLGGFWISPGFCTEFMHVYLAQGLLPGDRQPEEDEEIHLVRVPLGKVPELIRQREIKDGKSIAALLMVLSLYRDHLRL